MNQQTENQTVGEPAVLSFRDRVHAAVEYAHQTGDQRTANAAGWASVAIAAAWMAAAAGYVIAAVRIFDEITAPGPNTTFMWAGVAALATIATVEYLATRHTSPTAGRRLAAWCACALSVAAWDPAVAMLFAAAIIIWTAATRRDRKSVV